MTNEQIELIVCRHKEGIELHKIAEEVGIAMPTLKRWITKIRQTHDLPWRSKSKNKTRMYRADSDLEATSWNVRLGNEYIQKEWRAA